MISFNLRRPISPRLFLFSRIAQAIKPKASGAKGCIQEEPVETERADGQSRRCRPGGSQHSLNPTHHSPHCLQQSFTQNRRMSMRVQLSSAIKEGFHGTVASDSAKSSLLRRASLQPIGELEGVISSADMDSSTLLPMIRRCVFVSQVRRCVFVLNARARVSIDFLIITCL